MNLNRAIGTLVVLCSSSLSVCGGDFTGTVNGVFSNPRLIGYSLSFPNIPEYRDNSATAVFNGVGSNRLEWGSKGSITAPPPNINRVTFTGFSIVGVPAGTEIPLGIFEFENGTTSAGSEIFGADLTLTLGGDSTVVPLESSMNILTTLNTDFDPSFDADYLSFSSFSNTFHVFERDRASATLYGIFIGDLEIELTKLAFSEGGGFVAEVPEPGALLMVAAAGVAWVLRRKWNRRGPAIALSKL
jgi:hypothetical protein